MKRLVTRVGERGRGRQGGREAGRQGARGWCVCEFGGKVGALGVAVCL